MKKLLSIITVFISLISFSQKSEFSYIKGSLHNDVDFTEMVFSESDNKGGAFVLKRRASGVDLKNVEYKLEHFDSKMKTIDSYIFPKKSFNYFNFNSIIGMYTHEDKIILIEISIKDKTETWNALISNQNKLNFNEKKELYSDKENAYMRSAFKMNKNNSAFVLVISKERKKLLESKMFIYDKSLNKKSEISYTKDTKEYRYVATNIQLANDSKNVFVTSNSSDNKNKFYELTKLNQESQKSIVFENNSNSKFLGIQPFLNNEDIHIFSYYTDKENTLKGIAYQKIDFNNFTANKFTYNEFTEQFYYDKFGENKKSKKELKIQDVVFKNIFLNENNEFVINAEESNSYERLMAINNTYTLETNYFLDIHLIKINSDGKLAWSRLINKLHVCNGDYSFVSLFSFMKNDYNYLIFNSGKVITEDKYSKDRPYFRQTFGYTQDLVALKVDNNGNYTYEKIFDYTKNEVMCEIKDAKLINNDFIFLGSKRNENQFLKYTIN